MDSLGRLGLSLIALDLATGARLPIGANEWDIHLLSPY
jgi:hypothetical protein